MSFAQCVRDLAREAKTALEGDLEDERAEGRSPLTKWKVDYVEHVDCITDLLVFLEPFWGPFFADTFREVRRLLREFEMRQRQFLQFARGFHLTFELNHFQQLAQRLKAFEDELKKQTDLLDGCPPAQLLVQTMTLVRSIAVIRQAGAQLQSFYERGKAFVEAAEDDPKVALIPVLRAVAKEMLDAEGDTDQMLAAWLIAAVGLGFVSVQGLATPAGRDQALGTLIGSLTSIIFLLRTEGEDGQSVGDQIAGTLRFLEIVRECLVVSEDEVLPEKPPVGPGTDFRFPPDPTANYETREAALDAAQRQAVRDVEALLLRLGRNIPGPDPRSINLLPPL